MAVRRSQIWRDKRLAVGVTQLLRMTSFHQTLRINITAYDTNYRRDPFVISGVLNGGSVARLLG